MDIGDIAPEIGNNRLQSNDGFLIVLLEKVLDRVASVKHGRVGAVEGVTELCGGAIG